MDHPLAPHLSSDLLSRLLATAKPKARSTETHDNLHVPELKALDGPVQCLLLGDSMFERFKTTGRNSHFGDPSSTSMPFTQNGDTIIARVIHPNGGIDVAAGIQPTSAPTTVTLPGTSDPIYPDPSLVSSWNQDSGIFNAGCGGDTIRNVIHRLIGTTCSPGLLELLHYHPPRHIFLCMGTNDLGDGKKPLTDPCLTDYSLVLMVLVTLFPSAKICVCGLNPKRRVKRVCVVEDSNRKLEEAISECNEGALWSAEHRQNAEIQVDFLPSDPGWIEHLENDGVHLNEAGYALFGQRLWKRYEDMKQREHCRTANEQNMRPKS